MRVTLQESGQQDFGRYSGLCVGMLQELRTSEAREVAVSVRHGLKPMPSTPNFGPAFALRATARQALDYLTAMTDPPVRKYSVPSEIAGVAIA